MSLFVLTQMQLNFGSVDVKVNNAIAWQSTNLSLPGPAIGDSSIVIVRESGPYHECQDPALLDAYD